MLLLRYGVVFRDVVVRETNVPQWGVLLRMFRRLEDRGEVRGGRFVNGFRGEQFALAEVPESLRAARSRRDQPTVTICGADPMNLVGVLVPGDRTHAVAGFGHLYFRTRKSKESAAVTLMPPRQVRQRSEMRQVKAVRPEKPSRQVSLFGGEA